MSIFDSVRNYFSIRVESANPIKDIKAEVFKVQKEEVMPHWVKDLVEEVNELKGRIAIPKHQQPSSDSSCSSEQEVFKAETMDVCIYAGKAIIKPKIFSKGSARNARAMAMMRKNAHQVSPKKKRTERKQGLDGPYNCRTPGSLHVEGTTHSVIFV